MKKERQHQAHKSVFETPEAVMKAAELAGLDTEGKTLGQIEKQVIKAGAEIISRYPKIPKNYRTIKYPPEMTPLIESVLAITLMEAKKNR